MKKYAIWIVIALILIILTVMTFLHQTSSETEGVVQLETGNFSTIDQEYLNVYQQLDLSRYLQDDNLTLANFYTDDDDVIPEFIPGVYMAPDNYFSLKVDSTTGSISLHSNMMVDFVPPAIFNFFNALNDYENGLIEKPEFTLYACEEELYPGCYQAFKINPQPKELISDFSSQEILQIIQIATNPEHQAMQLYLDDDIYVIEGDDNYNALLEENLVSEIIASEEDPYAQEAEVPLVKVNVDKTKEINNPYSDNLINIVSEELPEYIDYSYIVDGTFHYFKFELIESGYIVQFAEYKYADIYDYLVDDYPALVKEEDLVTNNPAMDVCPYNYSENPVYADCIYEVAV